jgi:ribosome maturation factor RimP
MNWQAVVERTVTSLGYAPVDLERSSGGLLRVYIERAADPSTITVEDCELVTRQLQLVLAVEGIDYQRLEVSSPGLDRPLRKPSDWQRFAGSRI